MNRDTWRSPYPSVGLSKLCKALQRLFWRPDAAVDDKAREVPGPTTYEHLVDWLVHVHRDFFLTFTSL
jgi:hypothetical protein